MGFYGLCRKSGRLKVVILVLVIVLLSLFWRPQTVNEVQIAIVTKLKSGTVYGSSEINAAKLFLEQNNFPEIELIICNDNWSPEDSNKIIKESIKKGVKFFILSNPSTVVYATIGHFSDGKAFAINTAATTNLLSKKDDYSFRIVPDVRVEQICIASYVMNLAGQNILVIKDTGNPAYTKPACEIFCNEISQKSDKTIRLLKTSVSDFRFEDLEKAMSEPYDIAYILAGSYQKAIGNVAQLSFKHNPEAPIMLTPWARSKNIVQMAGPAIENMILPSQYPSKYDSKAVNDFFSAFYARFNYEPYSMGIAAYQAMTIYAHLFAKNYRNPEEIRKYLKSGVKIPTKFGEIQFDQYGDMVIPYTFITDFKREFE